MSILFLRYNLVKQLNSCWTQLLHQNQMQFTIQKQIKLKLFYLLSTSWSFSFTSTTAARLWRFIFFMFYCKDIYSICHVNIYWVTSWVKCWCFTKNMKRSQLIFFSLLSFAISFAFTSTTAARLWRFIFFMFYCKDIYSICHVNIYWVTSWVKCWCFTKNMKRSQLIFFSLLSFAIQIESLNVRFQLIFGL